MADPTIQTFCCHHGNGSDMAIMVMEELNTEAYNIVCVLSSALGVLGAMYQILPRNQYVHNHKWISITALRGRRIIVWLAIADLLASLGVLVRSSSWLHYKNIMPAANDNASVMFCALCSAFAQYFYMATWIWTLCYTIDMRLLLCEKKSCTRTYHMAAWTIPAILTSTGLCLLYLPDGECHTSNSLSVMIKILPNYLATYGPITVVMVANPLLYMWSSQDMENVITTIAGQFTSKEREVMVAIKKKFFYINLVFFICWIPNLINGILIWTLWFRLPAKAIISLWYIMAFVNPMQALFNCIVYRRWVKGSERLKPWAVFGKMNTHKLSDQHRAQVSSYRAEDETVPLLENVGRGRINDYSL